MHPSPTPPQANASPPRATVKLSPLARIVASGLPALVVLVFGLVVHSAYRRTLENAAAVERGARVSRTLEQLLSRLKDAETAQRGYVLTGDESYLQPYRGVRGDAAQAIATLQRLVEPADQRARLDTLRTRVDARLAISDRIVALRRTAGEPAAEAAIRSGEGKAAMDEIRARVARLEGRQAALLALRTAAEERTARRTTALLVGGTILCGLLALGVNLILARYGWEQARTAREMEEQNHLLEEQAVELELQGQALQENAVELEEAYGALQEREERFRALIENASDVITVLAPDGGIRYESPSLERILGYTPEEMLGRNALDYIHPEDAPSVYSVIEGLTRVPGSLLSAEFRFLHKDGSWVTFESVGRNLLDHPSVNGIVANSRDITARKLVQEKETALAAEKAARAAAEHGEARIRDILESVTDAFYALDPEWRFTLANGPAERMFGAERGGLVGRNVWEVAPQAVGSPVHQAALYSMAERASVEVEAPSVLATDRWFHYHLYPAHEGVVLYARDVTESRQLQHALEQSEEAIRGLHDITASRQYTFEEKVQRLLQMGSEFFQLPAGLLSHVEGERFLVEVATESCTVATGEAVPLGDTYCSATLLSHEPVSFAHAGATEWRSHRGYARHGVEAYLGTAVVVAGRPYGTLCFTGPEPRAHDFTGAERDFLRLMAQWVGGEIERRQGEDRLRTAKEEAEAANRAKSEFLSRMSHELRTPLNAILGFGQLLEMDAADPDTAESVEQILRAGRHLLALIDEVLDLARIEAGRMSLSVEPVAVQEVVRESLDLVRHMAAEHGVALHAAAALECPYTAAADMQRLKQVLLNLLSNAIKYNRRGGTVTLTCEPVAGELLCIAVQDTGFGIPAGRLAQLFTPFERLGAEEGSVQGTGLGLALSRGLVEAMGGRMGVESMEGVGSRFQVEIPMVAAPEEGPGGETPEEESARPAAPGGTRTVLVVEDNPWNVRLLERLFSSRPDLRLEVAMTGSRGLELAREHRPDLILLDLNLPDISGEDVLQRVRRDPALRDVPILMVSGDAMRASMERMRQLGVRDYITKPYSLDKLLDTIDGHLPRD